nr:GatB/YqeY domain-containing protein [Ancylobacter crimeensis]
MAVTLWRRRILLIRKDEAHVLRDAINASLKDAMKAQDKLRLGTLRLINAAIKDRDIEARGHGRDPLSDDEVLGLLTKMIKQREESAKVYEEAGRVDLATQERDEVVVIQGFLPKQMTEAEAAAAVKAVIEEIGAQGLKDMGRTMAALKERYTGTMDFAKASGTVKGLLTAG